MIHSKAQKLASSLMVFLFLFEFQLYPDFLHFILIGTHLNIYILYIYKLF